MLIDAAAHISDSPLGVEAAAVAAEADGYGGLESPRLARCLRLVLAARATTSIAVGIGNNP